MGLSRLTIALLVAAGAGAAEAAPPATAEQAIAAYRAVYKPTAELDCPRGEDGEIVVCARRGEDPYRLPPSAREPGVPVRGEAPSGTAALDAGGCISRCQGSVGVNLLAVPGFIGRVIERLRDD